MTMHAIPRAYHPVALDRATCDGTGLITFPTDDGPEHYACHGCTACTSRGDRVIPADPFSRLPADDDIEPF